MQTNRVTDLLAIRNAKIQTANSVRQDAQRRLEHGEPSRFQFANYTRLSAEIDHLNTVLAKAKTDA